ncbi:hypothetical protein BUALT_Bualt18G0097000 [Buddleja alternifolia]|uniref:DUF506 family protein n=1 Tax=Buddleja alternifolia TaxID=168488 RepID=A0AAV6W5M7_9LAMI|nr:hypothetical protein BUALT_Bualt18G0097000 [Buddleja alternifolia]
MVNIPVRFKRVAAAFDEVVKVRSCESSGIEHSANLSRLVKSFLEREIVEERESEKVDDQDRDSNDDESEIFKSADHFEIQDSLKRLFDLENDAVRRNIRAEVEKALGEVRGGDESLSPEFKQRLVAQLRDRGFDAGICKSKWEKNNRCPSGDYEYIDINTATATAGTRYIIEISLAGEFTIARPTDSYTSLLETFPQIFVGKPDELKQVVRLMCAAIRKSMNIAEIRVPPWRRPAYMQNKWFGSYKRTLSEISRRKGSISTGWSSPAGRRTVGFMPAKGVSLYCREGFAAVGGGRIGNLTAAFNQKGMLL